MDSFTTAAPIHCQKLIVSPFRPSLKTLSLSQNPNPQSKLSAQRFTVRVSSSTNPNPNSSPVSRAIRTAASSALILAAASAALLSPRPSIADPIQETTQSATPTETTETSSVEFSPETVNSLRSLVYEKLDQGEDPEALAILNRLISFQPSHLEWKFLAARILNEMGDVAESRKVYEEILAIDPLSFEALFENAVLMDRSGEGEAVVERLERALETARSEQNERSARDVRLIMAQIKYLQKDVDQALEIYEELIREDPNDYRPYFCQGVILSLLERNKEAREKFAKYKELAPKKFEVDAFLQTPLSRVKLFGTEGSEI